MQVIAWYKNHTDERKSWPCVLKREKTRNKSPWRWRFQIGLKRKNWAKYFVSTMQRITVKNNSAKMSLWNCKSKKFIHWVISTTCFMRVNFTVNQLWVTFFYCWTFTVILLYTIYIYYNIIIIIIICYNNKYGVRLEEKFVKCFFLYIGNTAAIFSF